MPSRASGEIYGREFWIKPGRKRKRPPVTEWNWKPYDPARISRVHQQNTTWPNAIETNYTPASRRQKVVLVFEVGALNAGMLKELKAQSLDYFFVNYLQLADRGTVQIDLAGGFGSSLRLGPAELRFEDVAAVIWNPPIHYSYPPQRPVPRYMFFERWKQILRELGGLLPKETVWLPSHPLNGSQEWQNKLTEYRYAMELGLAVPQTLCTNDPLAAKAFIKRHNGQVLFREFGHIIVPVAIAFADASERALKRLPRSPCVFQQYIEKEYDVRAVVVGDSVFACRIDSQASERAKLDWRVYDNERVRWDRMQLPQDVEQAMLRLMERLDLKWGSFDLVKSTDGAFYFMEVNRPGASYWLLPFVGLDIPKEIVAYLKRVL